ncbi:hypothetical protein ACOMHN_036662 [Nucella lapillus]
MPGTPGTMEMEGTSCPATQISQEDVSHPGAREDSAGSTASHYSRTGQPGRFYPMRRRGAWEEAEMRNRSVIDQTVEGRPRGGMTSSLHGNDGYASMCA